MKQKIEQQYNLKNVVIIPNSVDFNNCNQNLKKNLNFDYILAVGQMENNVKQFDKLIKCYKKTNLPKQKNSFSDCW